MGPCNPLEMGLGKCFPSHLLRFKQNKAEVFIGKLIAKMYCHSGCDFVLNMTKDQENGVMLHENHVAETI